MQNLFGKWKWCSGFSTEQFSLLQKVREAVDEWVIQKGYTKKMLPTQEQIADDIGVPADQLRIYIRMKTRKTVLTWRKDLRLREAQRLLLDYPELPVSVVGEMAGMDDKSNFKRQFYQATGMTPRDWREKHLR